MIKNHFDDFIIQMRALDTRAELELEEIPAPTKLAPLAFAIAADLPMSEDFLLASDSSAGAADPAGSGSSGSSGDFVSSEDLDDEAYVTGRFVLLADPNYHEAWQGEFRAVTFVRAPIDAQMAADPMLNDVGWSWMEDALENCGARYTALSGTVTRVASTSYGKLAPKPDQSEIEIRGSWTPVDGQALIDHAKAWIRLLEMVAGTVPLPEGVSSLSKRR
jgi:hypothetical protein